MVKNFTFSLQVNRFKERLFSGAMSSLCFAFYSSLLFLLPGFNLSAQDKNAKPLTKITPEINASPARVALADSSDRNFLLRNYPVWYESIYGPISNTIEKSPTFKTPVPILIIGSKAQYDFFVQQMQKEINSVPGHQKPGAVEVVFAEPGENLQPQASLSEEEIQKYQKIPKEVMKDQLMVYHNYVQVLPEVFLPIVPKRLLDQPDEKFALIYVAEYLKLKRAYPSLFAACVSSVSANPETEPLLFFESIKSALMKNVNEEVDFSRL